jgi:hypothetical protein
MEIEIKRIVTNEFPNYMVFNNLLNDFEGYLNKRFANKSYGESVVKYFFGFELYKFDGGFAKFYNDDIESWKTTTKWFVTNAHFDWNIFAHLEEQDALKIIKEEFLASVDRIEKMKRKPKAFDNIKFREDLELVFNDFKAS